LKAFVLRKTGGPEVLKQEDVEEPIPGKGEVRVKMNYIGINYAEILSRRGLYSWAVKRPYILGMEGSGIIEEVGEGVDSKRTGQLVMVGTKFGTYAEKIVVPEEHAIQTLESFSLEENAAFLVNYMTAWVTLFRMSKLKPYEIVLITAAAGGVGTAAVQLASKLGSRVYGLVGSQEKIELIRSLGAIDGFNYRQKDYSNNMMAATGGIDVVLEMVGGEVFDRSLNLLRPFGRMVVAGFASLDLKKWNPFSWIRTYRDIPRFSVGKMAEKSIAVMSTHIGYLLDKDPDLLMLIYNDMKAFVTRHHIRPVICKVFPFDGAPQAHRFIESRKSYGKVLLKADN